MSEYVKHQLESAIKKAKEFEAAGFPVPDYVVTEIDSLSRELNVLGS